MRKAFDEGGVHLTTPMKAAYMAGMSGEGVKADKDKPRWDLLPFGPVSEIVDVLTFGARKYADNNWKEVPNAHARYVAAAFRHLAAYVQGEKRDPETGLSHLAHAGCCLLFLQWFEYQARGVDNA